MLTIIKEQKEITPITKIYAFDFDDTLVCQKSSSKFPDSADDWKPLYENTKNKLQSLYNEGWTLVIFTNQGGVEKNKVTLEVVEKRLHNFLDYVSIPIHVFAAINYDNHRKPHTLMWKKMLEVLKITKLSDAIYVGDSAGRIYDKSKDISCSDRKFAYNIGIKFETPEHCFLKDEFHKTKFLNHNMDEKWSWDSFDSKKYLENNYKNERISSFNGLELVLLIGPQASGKSTFCKKYFPNYIRINQDILKTKAKCLKLTKETLNNKKSLIIDNTNSDIETRKLYTEMARDSKYHIRFIVFDVQKDMAIHLDEMRVELLGTKPIPAIAFNIFFKNLRENPPTLNECDEMIYLKWIPEIPICPEFLYKY